MTLTLSFLGGAGTVTGSRYVLESGDRRVLVDCGLFQGLKQLRLRNWAPFPVRPQTFSAAILTHAHLDHSGYLPRLVRDGLQTTIVLSDGGQPVGRGIGPALEARDVLAVLQQAPDAPQDLQERACRLAGALLELGDKAVQGEGEALARATLRTGRAWDKFQRICEAQGGMRTPPAAGQRHPLSALGKDACRPLTIAK